MRIALFLAAIAMSPACTVYHHCSPRDRAQLDDAQTNARPLHTTPVTFREVPAGEAKTVPRTIAVYTHASQYKPADGASIDFAREEVLRITAPGMSRQSLLWIVEREDEISVGVVPAERPCVPYPTPDPPQTSIDVVIPLTTKPVRMTSRFTGGACDLGGRG